MAGETWLGTVRRFVRLSGGFWRQRQAWLLGASVLTLNGAEVSLLLRLNGWNRDLFNALQLRDAHGLLAQCGVLALLVAGFAAVNCLGLQARRGLALGWRAWLAARLTSAWLQGPARGPANVDGRIAEDARIATEEAVELAASCSHGLITLSSFIGVLWALSAEGQVTLAGLRWDVPGYLFWVAIGYAGLGMAGARLLGRPLVQATDHRQAQEADYRAALLAGRQGGASLAQRLAGVAAAFSHQTRAAAHLQLFCVGNSRIGGGLPILVAAPAWLAGDVTLGWAMQAAQAFEQVAGALNWPVDNMPRLATWRASAERVLALHAACEPEATADRARQAVPAPA